MTKGRAFDLLILALLVAIVVMTFVAYDTLPDPMPTHFDASGRPNGWSPRMFGAWLSPGIAIVMTLGLGVVARAREDAARKLRAVSLVLTIVFGGVQVLVLQSARAEGHTMSDAIWIFILVAVIGVPATLVAVSR